MVSEFLIDLRNTLSIGKLVHLIFNPNAPTCRLLLLHTDTCSQSTRPLQILVHCFPLSLLLFPWRLCLYITHVQNGYTALISASGKGHTATVKVLVEAGADKDIKDKVRDTV